jgi:hypothetical protein
MIYRWRPNIQPRYADTPFNEPLQYSSFCNGNKQFRAELVKPTLVLYKLQALLVGVSLDKYSNRKQFTSCVRLGSF